jgi:probable phosphomutase (TIGR03848 family)
MTELLLVRHAINDWVKTGRLAGWTPGVHLNPDGQNQAQALAEHLAKAKLAGIYSSPLERTMETAEAIAAHYPSLTVQVLDGVGEVRYGTWQGAKLARLRKESLWRTVQQTPSRAHFPEGEAIRQAQARAVDALEGLVKKHSNQRVVVVSHSDVIKLIIAHYIGAHIDLFQRIEISPASMSVIWLGMDRPIIRRVNDTSYLPALPPPQPATSPLWNRVRHMLTRRTN